MTRPADIPSISNDLTTWWDGISKGEIKFIDGLPLLREYIPAWIRGHMNVVGGYTSAGKSQILTQIIADAAGVKEEKCILFSLEDSRKEKLMSIISLLTGIHKRDQLLGNMTEYQREEVKIAQKNIECWPLLIYDDVRTLDGMRKIISDEKPAMVGIDYIQRARVGRGSIYENMSFAAGELFDTAQDEDCALTVLSQVGIADAKEPNPNVIPLKGAGEIGEAAHAVVIARKGREEHNKHSCMLDVKKNKAFGPTGQIECEYSKDWTKIVPVRQQQHEERLRSKKRSGDD